MTHAKMLVLSLTLGAILAGCGRAPAPPATAAPRAAAPEPAAPPAAVATAPTAAMPSQPASPPPPAYDGKGRRDPFEPLDTVKAPARGPSVASAKLTGIVRGPQSRLALIETSDGIGYIVKPGDAIGDGRLVEIRPTSVVLAITAKEGTGAERVVLSLATE